MSTTTEAKAHNLEGKLSVSEDDRVRAIRNRMQVAQVRIELAMGYIMFPEIREELRGVRADLALALSYIGG